MSNDESTKRDNTEAVSLAYGTLNLDERGEYVPAFAPSGFGAVKPDDETEVSRG